MDNKAATIITGGGRGIGRASALRMASETPVMLVARTRSDLMAVCNEIRAQGGIADYLVGDVSKPGTAERCVAKVHKLGWTVRHLVANAGIANGGPSESFDKKLFADILSVNVCGSMWFAQACLPDMLTNKAGTICLMSSIAGLKGYKRNAAYCASKHALVGLAKTLGLEYAGKGIVSVALCPAFVDSDMTRRTIAGLVKHQGLTEADATRKVESINPQRRIIPASEVAEAVAMICAGKLLALNGSSLVLSGGE